MIGKKISPPLAGHRGMGCTNAPLFQDPCRSHLPPENSLSAIMMAFEKHAAFVEIDVVSTNDHVMVLCHSLNSEEHFFEEKENFSLDEKNYDAIKNLYTGMHQKETLCTLEKALHMLHHTSCKNKNDNFDFIVNIEIKNIKDDDHMYWNAFYESLQKTIEKSGLPQNNILFSSFSLQQCCDLTHYFPQSQFGFLFNDAKQKQPINDSDEFGFPIYTI